MVKLDCLDTCLGDLVWPTEIAITDDILSTSLYQCTVKPRLGNTVGGHLFDALCEVIPISKNVFWRQNTSFTSA